MSIKEILSRFSRIDEQSLKVNAADRVSSLLFASLILVVVCVACLGTLFVLRGEHDDPFIGDPEQGGTSGSRGFSESTFEFDQPEQSELADGAFPSASENVIHLVSFVSSELTSVSELENANPISVKGEGRIPGPVGGEGDGSGEGNGNESGNEISRADRWELRFSARDLRSYSLQLSSVGIELGTYGAGISKVEYASQFDLPMPVRREGNPNDEKRLYFVSLREGILMRYDKELLKRAGITLGGRMPMKFVSPEIEKSLATLERDFGRKQLGKDFRVDRIAKTVFECRPQVDGKGFEFVVLEQRYRMVR